MLPSELSDPDKVKLLEYIHKKYEWCRNKNSVKYMATILLRTGVKYKD